MAGIVFTMSKVTSLQQGESSHVTERLFLLRFCCLLCQNSVLRLKSWQAWAGFYFGRLYLQLITGPFFFFFFGLNRSRFSSRLRLLLLLHPHLPCKSSFSPAARENIVSFHPRLLCASAPPTAAAALLSAGWNSSDLMIFLLAVTLSPPPTAQLAPSTSKPPASVCLFIHEPEL